jgi:hypothetical protein
VTIGTVNCLQTELRDAPVNRMTADRLLLVALLLMKEFFVSKKIGKKREVSNGVVQFQKEAPKHSKFQEVCLPGDNDPMPAIVIWLAGRSGCCATGREAQPRTPKGTASHISCDSPEDLLPLATIETSSAFDASRSFLHIPQRHRSFKACIPHHAHRPRRRPRQAPQMEHDHSAPALALPIHHPRHLPADYYLPRLDARCCLHR